MMRTVSSSRSQGVFLSGPPGSGKSTLVAEGVSILRVRGCRLVGFLAPEERAGGRRVGFKLVDLYSGREWCLARRGLHSPVRVGSYGVCVGEVEAAAKVIREGIGVAQVIVADEIGPMELAVEELRDLIVWILSSDKPVIGVVHRRLKHAYPSIYRLVATKGVVLWLTRENRSLIRPRFLSLVEEIAVENCGDKRREGAAGDTGSLSGSPEGG